MPIKRYGVLRAAVIDRRIETSDTPHYQIRLRAAGADYRAAVNVRSQQSPPELLYLAVDDFGHPILDKLATLPDGFTELPGKADGPALDYIRGNLFQKDGMRPVPTAAPGPDNDLGDFIDHYVRRAQGDDAARAYVFGQAWGPEAAADKIFRFKPGNGVHDVHMNQGNSGRFADDDGVYQDGGLLLHFPSDDSWVAIFLAFQSQSWHTDDTTGHTLPDGQDAKDLRIRIVAALPNAERQTVTLVNTTAAEIDLKGWAITDGRVASPLDGTVAAGDAVRANVEKPLKAEKGTITLLDAEGLKVDGVAYTAAQRDRTIVF